MSAAQHALCRSDSDATLALLRPGEYHDEPQSSKAREGDVCSPTRQLPGSPMREDNWLWLLHRSDRFPSFPAEGADDQSSAGGGRNITRETGPDGQEKHVR